MPFEPIGRPFADVLSPARGAWVRQQDGGYLFERRGEVSRDGEIRSNNYVDPKADANAGTVEREGAGWKLQGNGLAQLSGLVVPSARVRRTTAQSISNTTYTAISFQNTEWDTQPDQTSTNGLHCHTPGIYIVTLNSQWQSDSPRERAILAVTLNSTTTSYTEQEVYPHAGSGTSQADASIAVHMPLEVGDVVGARVWHRLGSSSNILTVWLDWTLVSALPA